MDEDVVVADMVMEAYVNLAAVILRRDVSDVWGRLAP